MNKLIVIFAILMLMIISCTLEYEGELLILEIDKLESRIIELEDKLSEIHTHERTDLDKALFTYFKTSNDIFFGIIEESKGVELIREAVSFDEDLSRVWSHAWVEEEISIPILRVFINLLWVKFFELKSVNPLIS